MRTRRKKGLAFVLALTLLSTMVFGQPVFGAHWADVNMNRLANKNVMRGDEQGNFNPNRNITRAEFAAMLNRAFGFQERKGSAFSDVLPEAWYADDISFSSYQGFFQGPGGGIANPNGNLTREEAVTMICRAIKIEAQPFDSMLFADSRNFSAWSRGYINAAAEKGFINGYGDGTFKPGNHITRGEVAKLLDTVAGEIVNQPSQAYLGYVDGNVTLSKSGAGLRDTVITGDLYITEGVLDGYVFLENVTVLGTIYVSGAGEAHAAASSIVLTDCEANNIIIDLNHGKKVSLIAQGNTEIKNTIVKTQAYLEENNVRLSAFNNIQLRGPSGTKLDLSGEFAEVRIMAPGNEVMLNKGIIDILVSDELAIGAKLFLERNTNLAELYVDGNLAVTGSGKIGMVSIGANGANIAQMPGEIYIKPGYTATINGKSMGHLDAELENLTPRIHNNYPQVREITANTAVGQLLGNKPGTIYWAVKEQGADAPTADEMKEPKKGETKILQSGSTPLAMTAVENEAEIAARIAGLKNGGEYDLYAMLVDSKGTVSRVRSIDFETLDRIVPTFVSGYPKGMAESTAAITSGSAILVPAVHYLKFDLVPTKPCNVFWIIMPERAAAPNADRLYAGNGMAGEVAHSVRTIDAPENVLTTITMGELLSDGKSLLAEGTNYDVYIGLKDARGNVSAVNKTTIRTKDVTAPEFVLGYPMLGVVSETSVPIRFMTDEASTLFWVIMNYGTAFPPGAPQLGELVDNKTGDISYFWRSEEAKNAVEQARGALRSGRVSTVADREGTLSITGLRAETTYDLYLMLKDASGNRGVVGKMEITTKSVLPPVSSVAFDPRYQGTPPPVGSVIRLEFNKPVKVGQDGTTTKVMDLVQAGKLSELSDYIELYKIDDQNPTQLREKINIDFGGGGVKIDEPAGQGTVFSFQTSSTTGPGIAVRMESGGKYEFDLKGFWDLSDIPMRQNIRNDRGEMIGRPVENSPFVMMPPSVKITNLMRTGPPLGATPDELYAYEIMFGITPDEETAGGANEALLYDTVLELVTDKLIAFDLYDVTTSTPVPVLKDQILLPGRFIMIENERAREEARVDGTFPNYQYMEFNNLPPVKRYALKITALGGGSNPLEWNDTVTLNVYGIAGYRFNLMTFDVQHNPNKLEDAAKAPNAGIDVVGYPPQFPCEYTFVDTNLPTFVDGPSIIAGDTIATITGIINKAASIYCYLTPREGVEISPPSINANRLITGTVPQGGGSVWVKIDINDAQAGLPFSRPVTGLLNGRDYVMFYTWTQPGSQIDGGVRVITFETKPPIQPRFTTATPRQSSVENGVRITVAVEANDDLNPGQALGAVVDWIVYHNSVPLSSITPDVITRPQNSPEIGTPIRGGSFQIRTVDGEQTFIVSDPRFVAGTYYNIFLTTRNENAEAITANYYAKNRGSGATANPNISPDSRVIMIPNITPSSNLPPMLSEWSSYSEEITTGVPGRYDGSITFLFSGALWIPDPNSVSFETIPLTSSNLTASSFSNIGPVTVTGIINLITIPVVHGGTTHQAIRGFTIRYSGATSGNRINSNIMFQSSTGLGANGSADGYLRLLFEPGLPPEVEGGLWRLSII